MYTLIYLDHVDSTNRYAADYLQSHQPSNPCVIHTNHQTEGRGQYGRTWVSEKNESLCFSLIIPSVNLPLTKLFLLHCITSLSIVKQLQHYYPELNFAIKWPNDIYCLDKKICGILIQNVIKHDIVQDTILGIGINVNNSHFSNLHQASSLYILCQRMLDLNTLMDAIVREIIDRFQIFCDNEDQLLAAYNELLFCKNTEVEWMLNEHFFQARIIEVNSLGQIQLRTQNENIQWYSFGEIQYVRKV